MRKALNLTGQTFGRLMVLDRVPTERGASLWRCECTCGQISRKHGGDLLRGRVRSCGCKQGSRSHGLSRRNGRKTPLYAVWIGMKQRCTNSNSQSYARYGGRGITVCEEWRDFAAFHAWATANGYKKGLTIERKDNDGDYEPSNCTWIPRGQQVNNRCTSRRLTFNGVTKTVGEWANAYALDRKTLGDRIKRGWPIERALTSPVSGRQSE
jgi:hypothetical protein